MNRFEFEDDMYVEINDDNSVSVFNDDGRNYKITGFDTLKNAKDFVFTADFTEGKDNDYFLLTGAKEKLVWQKLDEITVEE